jgi:hypothetical protein
MAGNFVTGAGNVLFSSYLIYRVDCCPSVRPLVCFLTPCSSRIFSIALQCLQWLNVETMKLHVQGVQLHVFLIWAIELLSSTKENSIRLESTGAEGNPTLKFLWQVACLFRYINLFRFKIQWNELQLCLVLASLILLFWYSVLPAQNINLPLGWSETEHLINGNCRQ